MLNAQLQRLVYGAMGVMLRVTIRGLTLSYRFRCRRGTRTVSPPGCDHYILAIWHRNLLSGILAQTGRRHVVMVSRSRDGEPVARLCAHLGHSVARGSSRRHDVDKGGRAAKDEMIAALRGGLSGALTVDGPRGPAGIVKPGIIDMARATGLPIIPYATVPARYWTLSSWDALRIPKPFTRIEVRYGPPMFIPQDTDSVGFAGYLQGLAAALDALQDHRRRPRCAPQP